MTTFHPPRVTTTPPTTRPARRSLVLAWRTAAPILVIVLVGIFWIAVGGLLTFGLVCGLGLSSACP